MAPMLTGKLQRAHSTSVTCLATRHRKVEAPKAEEVAQAQTSKTNTLTMSQQQFNKQANESHLAGGRYHMPIDTAEFAAKCKGGGFHGGLVEMNNCEYGANAHWKAPACPFDISDLI